MQGADGATWTIVVAAGRGSRFGSAKQFERVAGRRVLDWSVAAARSVSAGIVLVVPPEVGSAEEPTVESTVVGGVTRSASVRAGLAAVPREATVVLVHDAARPLASPDLFALVVAAVQAGADAVVPAVPVVDALRSRAGRPVDRDQLVAVQTPQGFRADALRAAHVGSPEATDDAALVEAAGGRLVIVAGERTNLKITERTDLVLAAALLET
ncbi:MAG: 2-C-methyl-D-erythritol 4-phosphate cytidylyltransferase [Actinomycetota bacterium]|nr:2-C-methyl-D-erythritol 4-phosphate cytidylyltransferase [Actinomycetota bacterium]